MGYDIGSTSMVWDFKSRRADDVVVAVTHAEYLYNLLTVMGLLDEMYVGGEELQRILQVRETQGIYAANAILRTMLERRDRNLVFTIESVSAHSPWNVTISGFMGSLRALVQLLHPIDILERMEQIRHQKQMNRSAEELTALHIEQERAKTGTSVLIQEHLQRLVANVSSVDKPILDLLVREIEHEAKVVRDLIGPSEEPTGRQRRRRS